MSFEQKTDMNFS